MSGNEGLANPLKGERRFAPPAVLAEAANVTAHAEAMTDRLGFWAAQVQRLSRTPLRRSTGTSRPASTTVLRSASRRILTISELPEICSGMIMCRLLSTVMDLIQSKLPAALTQRGLSV